MSLLNAQQNDWANLERYRAANEKLMLLPTDAARVVFMGNSITEGWDGLYPEYFAGKPYINRGISGQTTPQMLVRFRQDVIELNPAAVVILAGTNDIAGNTGPASLETIAGNIFSMCELAKAHQIRIVLCSVLPAYDYPWSPGKQPAEKIVALNSLLQSYAEKNNIYYLDYFSPMKDAENGLKKAFSEDGVHPNAEGYKMMAALTEEALKRLFNSK